MELISKRDALDKVHKAIENLILRLPSIRGADGEDYCADLASLAAYNMAYEHISREIESIPPWNTEEPEDVVKVVRCGECKFYTDKYCHQNMQYGLSVTESDYCSKGERKDG